MQNFENLAKRVDWGNQAQIALLHVIIASRYPDMDVKEKMKEIRESVCNFHRYHVQ